MTKVTVRREDGHIVSVESDGHTDYGEEGRGYRLRGADDVIQTAALGLFRVAGLREVRIERDDARQRGSPYGWAR